MGCKKLPRIEIGELGSGENGYCKYIEKLTVYL